MLQKKIEKEQFLKSLIVIKNNKKIKNQKIRLNKSANKYFNRINS